jgi:hypothetical protein
MKFTFAFGLDLFHYHCPYSFLYACSHALLFQRVLSLEGVYVFATVIITKAALEGWGLYPIFSVNKLINEISSTILK